MNAIVLNTANDISVLFSNLSAKASHAIYKIGYHRAAAELSRLGYNEEAKRCMIQYHNLD